MRSSDTPENDPGRIRHDDPELLRGPQGPTDWSREPRSDDLLLAGLLERLARRAVQPEQP